MADRLRQLWDFDDLDSTESRLRALFEQETDDGARAEILTQLARIEGLRGSFGEAERLVADAEALAGTSGVAAARIALERGRILRSSGRVAEALPHFERAFATARGAGEQFIAVDAAHMAALAAGGRDGFVEWTERGIALAENDESASYWLGPLLNNLGWEHFEAGQYADALSAFERALTERERDPGNQSAIEIARYAVAKTLRALGRSSEAVPLLEQSVAWAESEDAPDGWFHEELALSYADLGRAAEAADQARKSLALLPEADPTFESDGERETRLRRLAS